MTSPPAESPAVARRRLRLALRRAREENGFTQHQVADEMEWSISKVMRIESGEVTISVNDTRSLLNYLGISDPEEVARLIQSARDARKREWWDEAQFREHLPPAMRRLIQFETEARTIRYFLSMLIPGPLQVPDYAQAVFAAFQTKLPEATATVRREARQRRRQAFLERRDNPAVMLLLDESVLHRTLGDYHLLATQLFDLHSLATQGRLTIRIIPFTTSTALAMLATFEIYDFSDPDDSSAANDNDAVLYRESNLLDELVEDDSSVSRHLTEFTDLWNAALNEGTSIQMILEAAQKAAALAGTTSTSTSQ
ncbi:transcriptional regulator with XRE-family HTH domain [Catenuloplanes nepalensis]|uniref:Transcriptional regulator with XRE-family HTH domain n=1 Tax=Catenuloplanes nepalensis TaxID=587533 RepID=A0ABT9MJY8_9ACTN|nr:helix-turn-helix transcriptional regulator [Catenuloplanes nepalensis]MDP9791727.1 transcriptional regulator with XRE-family HTH domain [Catenuloplanes nepalensis]